MFTQALNWISYADKESAFTAYFPAKPVTKEKIIRTDIGETMINTVFLASAPDSTQNSLYLLNYYKLDEIIFFGDSAMTKQDYLLNTLNNIKDNLNAELLYSNPTTDKGCPTVIYRLELQKGDKVMKGKLILSNSYFYSLQVFSTKKYSLNKNMDKFLDSFSFKTCD